MLWLGLNAICLLFFLVLFANLFLAFHEEAGPGDGLVFLFVLAPTLFILAVTHAASLFRAINHFLKGRRRQAFWLFLPSLAWAITFVSLHLLRHRG